MIKKTVGDLVQYGSWYTGKPDHIGLVIESCPNSDFVLVAWPDRIEWEGNDGIQIVEGCRLSRLDKQNLCS